MSLDPAICSVFEWGMVRLWDRSKFTAPQKLLKKTSRMITRKGYGSVRPTKSQILVFLFASTRPQMSAGPRQIHVPGSSSRSHHPFPRGSLRPHGVDGSCRDAQPQAQRSGTEWNCRWRSAKGHIQCWWLWKAQDKPRVARYDCWCKKKMIPLTL